MSWSAGSGTEPITKDAIDAIQPPDFPNAPAESAEQFEQAKAAAKAVVASGAVGTGKFRVSLSGHANEDHANPVASWANEMVAVNVSNAAVKEAD